MGFNSWFKGLNICIANTFRCILVFVATSSDHQTTNSRDEQHSMVVCGTLGRRSASATTCHRDATDYCDAPLPSNFSPNPPNCFQHVRPRYCSLYLLTSVYVTHIKPATCTISFLSMSDVYGLFTPCFLL